MLYRMYSRFVERHGFSMEVLDYIDGDIAGIKNVTFEVHGENAYGFLKSEKGIHRLVRSSPFNSAGKRQTSFASCDVIPDIDKEIDIEINEDDLKIDSHAPKVRTEKKVYPNDPCPCGSGLKYKQCCGKKK